MKEIKIPKSWNEVKLKSWKELIEIENTEGLSRSDKNVQILSCLSGVEINEIESLPLYSVSSYMSRLNFLQTPPKPGKTRRAYTLGGTKYTVFKRIEDITAGMYIDFQNYCNGNLDEHISQILSIILIPEDHKYNEGYSLEDTIDDIDNNLGIEDALSLFNFFLKRLVKSTRTSLQSSLGISMRMVKRLKKTNPEKAMEIEQLVNQLLSTGLL